MKKQHTHYSVSKMNRLVKGLEFETVNDYYEYIVESHINGQSTQVKMLFADMPLVNREDFKQYIVREYPILYSILF